MAIKNFWSLNVEEAIVADRLQAELKNDGYEVFFPLRSQLKDVDLLLHSFPTGRSLTIQVKGSRAYPGEKHQRERFGDGGLGWIIVSKRVMFEPTNEVNAFVFLVHLDVRGRTKREIIPQFVVVPRKELCRIVQDHKKKLRKGGSEYHFFIWINPTEGTATDMEEPQNTINLTPYLNTFDRLRR